MIDEHFLRPTVRILPFRKIVLLIFPERCNSFTAWCDFALTRHQRCWSTIFSGSQNLSTRQISILFEGTLKHFESVVRNLILVCGITCCEERGEVECWWWWCVHFGHFTYDDPWPAAREWAPKTEKWEHQSISREHHDSTPYTSPQPNAIMSNWFIVFYHSGWVSRMVIILWCTLWRCWSAYAL